MTSPTPTAPTHASAAPRRTVVAAAGAARALAQSGAAFLTDLGPAADKVTVTDSRSVLSEVVTARFGVSTASVFPSFAPETVGVMSSL